VLITDCCFNGTATSAC